MLTLEQIFSFTEKELNSKLKEYKSSYSRRKEKLNAVIIDAFNNNQLNEEESKIVETSAYDSAINLNPSSYIEFMRFYNEFIRFYNAITRNNQIINLNMSKKSWITPKVTILKEHIERGTGFSLIRLNATCLAVSNKYIISNLNNKIKIWDLSTFEFTILEGHTEKVNCVAVSGIINTTDEFGNIISKQYIISGSSDNTIKIWDLSTFELVASLEGHTDNVNCVAVSNKYIISGSYDNTIKIWDLFTFKLVASLEGHTESVLSIAVSDIDNNPDNIGKQYIISGSWDKTIKIWNLSTFKLVATLKEHASVRYVKSNDNYIVSSSDDNITKLWKFINGKIELLYTFDGFNAAINDNIVITAKDNKINIWDIETFELIATLEGDKNPINSLTLNNNLIISSEYDDIIKVWQKN